MAHPLSLSTGVEKNKTLGCVEMVLEVTGVRAAASEKDVQNFWLGAMIFRRSYLFDLCANESPYVKKPHFWMQCFEDVLEKTVNDVGGVAVSVLRESANSFKKMLKGIPQETSEYGALVSRYVSFNLKAAQVANSAYIGGDNIRFFQTCVLDLLRADPKSNIGVSDDVWTLALVKEGVSHWNNKEALSTELASYLLEQNFQVPADKIEEFKLVLEEKNRFSPLALSNLDAQFLAHDTHIAPAISRRRPRL